MNEYIELKQKIEWLELELIECKRKLGIHDDRLDKNEIRLTQIESDFRYNARSLDEIKNNLNKINIAVLTSVIGLVLNLFK